MTLWCCDGGEGWGACRRFNENLYWVFQVSLEKIGLFATICHTVRNNMTTVPINCFRYRNKSGTAVWRRSGAGAVCARPVRDGRRPATECAWRPPFARSRRRPTTPPGKRCRTCRRPTRWRTRVVAIGRRRRRYRTPSSPWRRRTTANTVTRYFSDGGGRGGASCNAMMMYARLSVELLLLLFIVLYNETRKEYYTYL